MRWRSTAGRARRARHAGSSPTCPTTSRRRCWSRWLAEPDAPSTVADLDVPEGGGGRADRRRPAAKAYGRLAVLAAMALRGARGCSTSPPRAFVPPPKVDVDRRRASCRARRPLAPADPGVLERVTAAAFGQRRKMLRQSLKSLGGDRRPAARAAGIEPHARAPRRSIVDRVLPRLARAFARETLRVQPPTRRQPRHELAQVPTWRARCSRSAAGWRRTRDALIDVVG